MTDLDSDDTHSVARRCQHVTALVHGNRRQPAHRRAHMLLQEGPAAEPDPLIRRGSADPVAIDHDSHLGHGVEEHRTLREELVTQSREELVEHPPSTIEQHVRMAGLRYPDAERNALGRELVPLEHGDSRERVREHAGSEQSGHSRAEDRRMITCRPHIGEPPTIVIVLCCAFCAEKADQDDTIYRSLSKSATRCGTRA